VSLSNRRLWQRHSGADEWFADPVKKENPMAWDNLTLYQKFLNGGVGCDPILYKNHLNWLTRNGGFVLAAEESDGIMKRIIAFAEIWCIEEPAPMGKTGSIITFEVDTTFTEDPVSKLYTQCKKEIRTRGFSTLAVCPFSSRAVLANLDDSRWELLALTRRYRVGRGELEASELPHTVEDIPRAELPIHEYYCFDQSISPYYHWTSVWEEYELLPEMVRAVHRSQARKVNIERGGKSITAILWIWNWGDVEDYWRLSVWVPPELQEDTELLLELVKIAQEVWNTEEIPGFILCVDEEYGSSLANRGFKVNEDEPGEPRYYTGV